MKLHIVYHPHAAVPGTFAVSPARANDRVQANAMPVEPAADYVFDLGYYSFTWWSRLDAAGCRFVARLRKNSPAKVIAMRHVLKDGPIISAGMGARCTRAGQTSA